MIRRARARTIPVILALGLLDRKVVDASKARSHQAVLGELPVLIAVGAKPVAGIVVPLVLEAHGNMVFVEGPQLFDQAIVEFLGPLAAQEGFDKRTVLYTDSEFGRTSASAPGWGAHQLVLGAPVRGAAVYGSIPSSKDTTSDGAWITQYSRTPCRAYNAIFDRIS